jgi:hypothetical protein
MVITSVTQCHSATVEVFFFHTSYNAEKTTLILSWLIRYRPWTAFEAKVRLFLLPCKVRYFHNTSQCHQKKGVADFAKFF